ncbi:DUF1853 family protein [Flavivirga abyssicola]|uniref:DUF1853 family protein n=1 Tax=Flavivirga abyssicola TaxID=3063533 RepID=UPI0026DF7EE8|nr:DUF1853 family protein [Flavivirga sp. MEBiC07777]WVK14408.1 DUF1853 family protein [Flavivirga sp. MEBiC07777]
MIQKRYEGFLSTPFLWKGDILSNLNSFKITSKSDKIDINIDEKLRLGKYVERFVSFELEQHNNISILAENIQIQDNKITLGELDCLLLKNNKPIHLEIVYKFYVYDASIGKTEIEHFIDPNRKDSLKEKITKLEDKQLPLLHSNTCKNYLKTLNLKSEDISQQVYFKAQLFFPFSNQDIQLKTLNNDCIVGFYINKNQLNQFNDCKFYIPKKKDWLIVPHTNVKWLNVNEFKVAVKAYFEQQFSPLCWVKLKNGILKKIFLVWW